MKLKGLFAAGAVLALASAAYAANDAGCGLGSMLFKENTPPQQIVAATTNGISGNQTFGITTGTLGCGPGLLKTELQQDKYVNANIRDLSREMAAGKGEYVSSLAGLLGCTETSVDAFGKFTQAHYSVLFPEQNVAPTLMLKTLKKELAKDPQLGASCTSL
jgi:hypothetical protein